MGTIETFFHMGGYAAYVWPAFGVTVVLMGGLFVWSRHALRADRRTLDLLQQARRDLRRNIGNAAGEAQE
jgi:heme exporter protein D